MSGGNTTSNGHWTPLTAAWLLKVAARPARKRNGTRECCAELTWNRPPRSHICAWLIEPASEPQ